jgi:hypothetical protein
MTIDRILLRLFEKGALVEPYIAFFRGEKAVLGKFRAEGLPLGQTNQAPFQGIRPGAGELHQGHEGGAWANMQN